MDEERNAQKKEIESFRWKTIHLLHFCYVTSIRKPFISTNQTKAHSSAHNSKSVSLFIWANKRMDEWMNGYKQNQRHAWNAIWMIKFQLFVLKRIFHYYYHHYANWILISFGSQHWSYSKSFVFTNNRKC